MEIGISVPVFFEFKRIHRSKDSGILKIREKNIKKEIGLIEGNIVYAGSNSFDERLGVVLNLLGFISDSQFDHLSGLIFSDEKNLGNMLVNDKVVSKKELKEAEEYRIRRIAVTSFSAISSRWEFTRKMIPEELIKYNIGLDEILTAGASRFEVYDYIRLLHRFNMPVSVDIDKAVNLPLSMNELEIYDIVRKGDYNTNRDIIANKNFVPEDFWKGISVLFLLGLVKFKRAELKNDIEKEISLLLNIRSVIYENDSWIQMLGIGKNSSKTEILEALERSLIRFDPSNFGSGEAPELKRTAVEVCRQISLELKKYELEVENEEISVSSNIKTTKDKRENVELKADDFKKKMEKAVHLYDKGHYDEAIPILKDMLRVHKENTDILLLLGKCQVNVQFFSDEAIRNLSKVIEKKPANADAIFSLGMVFKNTKRYAKAERCFKKVLELKPGYFMAKRELGHYKRSKEKRISGLFKKKKK